MAKTVSASEAKNRFGSLLRQVADQGEEVIVERQGKPRAVILSFAEYERIQARREQERWE